METRVPARLTAAEGRKFAFTVGAAFAVLAGLLWWRDIARAATVLAGIAGALGVAGLLVPGSLGPVYRAWMGLAALLSRITNPIFLGIVYFLVITPVGLLLWATGKRPLKRRKDATTFWVDRPEGARRGDLRRQF